MNLVYQHASGGCLWQGGIMSANSVHVLDGSGIKAVVYAAAQNQPKLPDRFDVIRAKLDDDFRMRFPEASRVAFCVDEVSDLLVDYILSGENVLSSCWAGWNRSGLVSGMTVMKLTGCSAASAVRKVRRARGPSALGNPVFVKILEAFEASRSERAA